MDDSKRFFLAMILAGLVMAVYYGFYLKPIQDKARTQTVVERETAIAQQARITQMTETKDRAELITGGTRIRIDTPSLSGSFSTTGSRFDDLRLKNYNQTLADDSETAVLFSPEGASHAAYVFDNWMDAESGTGATTDWSVVSGDRLTVDTPVILEHVSANFKVTRTISVDENYLITLDDFVTNMSASEITVVRKGVSRQHDLPEGLTNFFILQEGPIAIIDGGLFDMKYKKLEKKRSVSQQGKSGWVGLTDKYWLAAAIPPQGEQMTAHFGFRNLNGQDVYEASYALAPMTLSPGASIPSKGYVFAGAKKRSVLLTYQKGLGITEMERAIDWGTLRILTRPFSWALTRLGGMTGNFGIGILLLTLILKIILFPLNNKAYSSMAKMKALQPKLEKMKKRYGDDRMKMQQEIMALYRKEGANPVAGCLPMIPQMFIFFALYKSLFITLEMRHAPFTPYIKDLSVREPASILNGFGLLPWDGLQTTLIGFLAIGPLAVLYGITMAMMQTLNAPPTDKTQARIFQLMPWFFMFILAPFAAGLLLYWVWNNILSLIQQYIITRKYRIETPLDRFFGRLFRKQPEAGSGES